MSNASFRALGDGVPSRSADDDGTASLSSRNDANASCRRLPAAATASVTSPAASSGAASLSAEPIGDGKPRCQWCAEELGGGRTTKQFCDQRCRQAAFRLRRLADERRRTQKPLRFAYADPPYPGFAFKLYKDEPTYAGEVDHVELVASLVDRYDGWALSTSARSLAQVLPLCPRGVRVCSWIKPIGVSPSTKGIHNVWEPLIVMPGRRLRPGKRDFLIAQPARGGGELMGRKPIAFAAWLFALLGMLPGDSLADLFPGTGIIGRCWKVLSAAGNDAGDTLSNLMDAHKEGGS